MQLDPRTVIVCGGRGYAAPCLPDGSANPRYEEQLRTLHQELEFLRGAMLFSHLVHGDAEGADRAAGQWAELAGVRCTAVPVDREHPKMRNMRMWQLHMPRHVLAFPGGEGTRHMVEYAESMGSRILPLPRPPREDWLL